MIPRSSTFFSVRHIAGKKVHYHCKIPKDYKHIKIESIGNDGVFRKEKEGDKSVITLGSQRVPIDINERKSVLLASNSNDVEVTFIEEGRHTVNGVEFYYLKAKHLSKEIDMEIITFLYSNEDFHVEISCSTDISRFGKSVKEYFDFINTFELHEKG